MTDDPNRPPSLGPDQPDSDPNTPNSFFTGRGIWLLLLLVVGGFLAIKYAQYPDGKEIAYSELKRHVEQGKVQSVRIGEQVIVATPNDKGEKALEEKSEQQSIDQWRAVRVQNDDSLIPLLETHDVEVSAEYQSGCEGSYFWLWIAPLLLMFLFWGYIMRRMGGGIGGQNSPAMNFGKTQSEVHLEEGTGVTFEDVAGCQEAKEELQEIIEFLKSPEKFTRLGGKVPKGVLLVGAPGTGKTLLARAVAGEADVPFFNLSGSDFVEMFVGVGAARVRDLFEQAKEKAPCIVFVDELDAIGKKRGSGGFQGNDEREQTLNALLVEMDGFDSQTGVIILSATNRPEILDPALLRAGRFDRQISVDRPDKRGRLQILEVHTRGVLVSDDVELEVIAAQTAGMVGSDLANAVNEAALLAARRDKEEVEMEDFQDAIERVMAGLEKRSRRLGDKERNIVAYHESGHAIVGGAVEHADRVHKVSIVSRGFGALGYTLQVPMEDRNLMTRNELLDKITTLLGGRAAESIVFGDISTGAANDLQRITDMARRMVREFGMSDTIGNVSYGSGGGDDEKMMQMPGSRPDYSEKTAEDIDREVHAIVERLFKRTVALLQKNREILEEMAEYLKENEVLDGDDLEMFLDRVENLDEEERQALEQSPNLGPMSALEA
jgi:cell division protease FtsH